MVPRDADSSESTRSPNVQYQYVHCSNEWRMPSRLVKPVSSPSPEVCDRSKVHRKSRTRNHANPNPKCRHFPKIQTARSTNSKQFCSTRKGRSGSSRLGHPVVRLKQTHCSAQPERFIWLKQTWLKQWRSFRPSSSLPLSRSPSLPPVLDEPWQR